MDSCKLKTPVVIIIFKRPDTTEKVFEVIRQARPPKLLVIADGPRLDKPGEAEKCAATRAIIERVDWDCEVLKNYSDINLGCGIRPATGISWVFEQVEEAIILEDDCLPHPTFFRFCDELLEKYRDDRRIMHITGNNFQSVNRNWHSDYSYYFSRYPMTWGWATWRRAWKYYDFEVKHLPEFIRRGLINNFLQNQKDIQGWTRRFTEVYGTGKDHIWDYQWVFTCWTQNGLAITPGVNLVANIGFNGEATHTKDSLNWRHNIPVEAMNFTLQHPPFLVSDRLADKFFQDKFFDSGLVDRIKGKVKKIFKM